MVLSKRSELDSGYKIDTFDDPVEVHEMSFTDEVKQLLIKQLTDLYSDPIQAAVRETVSNALDATAAARAAGENPDPVEICSPGIFNAKFIVKDHGTGMTKEELYSNFADYGNSTKISDMDSVGSKGLGAKAPLAYTNTFMVATVKNGHKIVLSLNRGEHTNEARKIMDCETDEPNGTIVEIPLNDTNDIESFTECIDVYRKYATPDTPILIDGERNDFEEHWSLLRKVKLDESTDGEPVYGKIYLNNDKIDGFLNSWLRSINNSESCVDYANMSAVLGGWRYDLASKEYHRYYDNDLIFVELLPGMVDFPGSRDTIKENGRLQDLRSKVNEVLSIPRKSNLDMSFIDGLWGKLSTDVRRNVVEGMVSMNSYFSRNSDKVFWEDLFKTWPDVADVFNPEYDGSYFDMVLMTNNSSHTSNPHIDPHYIRVSSGRTRSFNRYDLKPSCISDLRSMMDKFKDEDSKDEDQDTPSPTNLKIPVDYLINDNGEINIEPFKIWRDSYTTTRYFYVVKAEDGISSRLYSDLRKLTIKKTEENRDSNVIFFIYDGTNVINHNRLDGLNVGAINNNDTGKAVYLGELSSHEIHEIVSPKKIVTAKSANTSRQATQGLEYYAIVNDETGKDFHKRVADIAEFHFHRLTSIEDLDGAIVYVTKMQASSDSAYFNRKAILEDQIMVSLMDLGDKINGRKVVILDDVACGPLKTEILSTITDKTLVYTTDLIGPRIEKMKILSKAIPLPHIDFDDRLGIANYLINGIIRNEKNGNWPGLYSTMFNMEYGRKMNQCRKIMPDNPLFAMSEADRKMYEELDDYEDEKDAYSNKPDDAYKQMSLKLCNHIEYVKQLLNAMIADPKDDAQTEDVYNKLALDKIFDWRSYSAWNTDDKILKDFLLNDDVKINDSSKYIRQAINDWFPGYFNGIVEKIKKNK